MSKLPSKKFKTLLPFIEPYNGTESSIAQTFYDNVMRIAKSEEDRAEATVLYEKFRKDNESKCEPDETGYLYDRYGTGIETLASEDVLRSWGVNPDAIYELWDSAFGAKWYCPSEIVYCVIHNLGYTPLT